MKPQSNHNATEGDWKNRIHIISVHNISSKQKKMGLRPWKKDLLQVSYLFRSTVVPFLITNSQSNISLAWRSNLDIWRRYCSTTVAHQQSTQRVAENHYSNYIWNARSIQTWLPDKYSNAARYSEVLTLGVIQMHLTWLYNKLSLPILAYAGGGGIHTAIT